MNKMIEAGAKAIAEIIGPPVGNPEYLAKHGDRLKSRNDETALRFGCLTFGGRIEAEAIGLA